MSGSFAASNKGDKGDRVTPGGRTARELRNAAANASGGRARGGAGAHRARVDENGRLKGVARGFFGAPLDPKLRELEAKTMREARRAKDAARKAEREGNTKSKGFWDW